MADSTRSSGDSTCIDEALPIPIQVFLWRQIRYFCKNIKIKNNFLICSPFVKPKLGKLHEASCMVIYLKNKLLSLYKLFIF